MLAPPNHINFNIGDLVRILNVHRSISVGLIVGMRNELGHLYFDIWPEANIMAGSAKLVERVEMSLLEKLS